jgi:hypothetical protein
MDSLQHAADVVEVAVFSRWETISVSASIAARKSHQKDLDCARRLDRRADRG